MSGLGAGLGIQPTRVTWDQIVPGIGPYTPNSDGSPLTADTTLGPEHNLVVVDASGGGVTITLPLLSEAYQAVTIIKGDTSSNAVTVQRAGSDTMLAAGVTSITLNVADDAARLLPLDTWRYG